MLITYDRNLGDWFAGGRFLSDSPRPASPILSKRRTPARRQLPLRRAVNPPFSALRLPSPPPPHRAPANVRPPLPDVHLRSDPAVRRGCVRDLPVGRPGADRAGDSKGPFRGGQSRRRSGLFGGRRWLARPGVRQAGDPAEWRPDGASRRRVGARRAALFYVHPTTYLDTDRWNAPLDAGGDTAFRTNLFVQSQASAFNGVAQVWAPRYRQAAYGAFLLKSEDAEKALDLAYRDVAAAFDEFVKEAGDRPIILAGHSQGALHLERLLREKIAGKPIAQTDGRGLCRRLADQHGFRPSRARTAGLPRADETRCILSWMTFGDPPNPEFMFANGRRPRASAAAKRDARRTCSASIRSRACRTAPLRRQDNSGTLVPSADLTLGDAAARRCRRPLRQRPAHP